MKKLFVYFSFLLILWFGFSTDSSALIIQNGESVSLPVYSVYYKLDTTLTYTNNTGLPVNLIFVQHSLNSDIYSPTFFTQNPRDVGYNFDRPNGSASITINGHSFTQSFSYFVSEVDGKTYWKATITQGRATSPPYDKFSSPDYVATTYPNLWFTWNYGAQNDFTLDGVTINRHNDVFWDLLTQHLETTIKDAITGANRVVWKGLTNGHRYGYSDYVLYDKYGNKIRSGTDAVFHNGFLDGLLFVEYGVEFFDDETGRIVITPTDADDIVGQDYVVNLTESTTTPTVIPLPEPPNPDDRWVVPVPIGDTIINIPIIEIIEDDDKPYPVFDIDVDFPIDVDIDISPEIILEIIYEFSYYDIDYIINNIITTEPNPDYVPEHTLPVLQQILKVLRQFKDDVINRFNVLFTYLHDIKDLLISSDDSKDKDKDNTLDLGKYLVQLLEVALSMLTALGGLFAGFFTFLGFLPDWASALCGTLIVLTLVVFFFKFFKG